MKLLKITDFIRSTLFLLIMVTTFNSTVPHLILALLLFFLVILKRNLSFRVHVICLIPLLIFLISIINTFLLLSFSNNVNEAMMLLRARKFLAELIVAYSVLFFCINTPRKTILKLLYVGICLSFIVGIFQVILKPTERPSMLFLEPSSAGYFIGTFIFLILYKKSMFKNALFLLSILLIRSKGMILSIILTTLFRSPNFKTYSSLLLLIMFSAPFLHDFLLHQSGQYFGFIHLLDVLYNHGMSGFSSTFGVYNTYLTRLTAIFLGIKSLIDNPLGLGFGAFHSVYLNNIFTHLHINDLGSEIIDSLYNGGMITPKSNLIEQLISSGIFGLVSIIYFFRSIMKNVGSYYRASVICFIILSSVTELNNFYLYMVLLAYFYKGCVLDKK